ncbi:MAG: hypothetical protein JXN60_02380 [Lentisphaerae bacterium]|nr:hypothetical protein [Lentisphaerota bacterium]
MSLVKENGHLFIHTVCNGYFNHGFHTFSPDCLLQALDLNGFSIRYLHFSTPDGIELNSPSIVVDALIWLVARRDKIVEPFSVPQQQKWAAYYQ